MESIKRYRVIIAFAVLTSEVFLGGCALIPSAAGSGLSVENEPIPGPGHYEIKIIIFNATLRGPITCDNGVTVTLSGPSEVVGNQEITPAILEVPQSFPEGLVTCFAPTSTKTFPFTIWVGPPQPKGFPQVPLRLSVNKKSVLCKAAHQRVDLQLTMRNELSELVTVVSIASANRLLILVSTSPQTPITLAPGEQREVLLQFTCAGFGIVKNSFVKLRLADGSVMAL